MVKAAYIWSIVSDQLCDVLGEEIHRQWFKNAKPLVIADQMLLIELPNHFAAQWVHAHYQELVDVLIGVLDKNLSSFFFIKTGFELRHSSILRDESSKELASKGTTSEIGGAPKTTNVKTIPAIKTRC